MVVSGSAAVTYLLDTHRANALHILALSNFGKNMVLYASTFFANGIILSHGVKVSLLILGGCQAVCWAASVPMFVFGKRVRSFLSICIGCCFREPRTVLGVLADQPCRLPVTLNCSREIFRRPSFPTAKRFEVGCWRCACNSCIVCNLGYWHVCGSGAFGLSGMWA